MDKLAFDTLEKLLDTKLKNYNQANLKEFKRINTSLCEVTKGIDALKETTTEIHFEAKKTNGRVYSLEDSLEETNARVWNLEQYQMVCPIKDMKDKLDLIDSATSFKQAMIRNPKLGKRIFIAGLVFILLVSLPLWIAYWDVIVDLFGSISRLAN